MSIKVEGLRETQRALRKLGDIETPKAIKAANKRAAERVVKAALPNVPVATEKLKRSVRALASQRAGKAVAGGARVPYGPAVHWGTGPRAGLRGPHNIRRRPFLWDAAQRLRDRVGEEYLEEMERIIDKLRFEKGRER